MKSIFRFLCSTLVLVSSLGWGQQFQTQTISGTSYIIPVSQLRLSSMAFNPPLVFDIGGTSGTQCIFQAVPLTPANTVCFNVAAPAQATVYKFTDPGATGTLPFLETANSWAALQTFSLGFTVTSGQQGKLLATSNQLKFGGASANVTFSVSTPASSNTVTFPDAGSGGTVPYAIFTDCGSAAACSATTISSTVKIVKGTCPASSATTCTVTAISPAFTSSSTYVCNVTDGTTAANNALKITYVSGSSFTITTSSSSDVFSYACIGT